MTTYIFAGMSIRNKEVIQNAKVLLPKAIGVEYDHWNTGKEMDLDLEASKISFKDGDIIIAKSIGTIVALKALLLKPAEVQLCCMGVPLKVAEETSFPLIPLLLENKHIIYQNEFDPIGAVKDLAGLHVIPIKDNSTHKYDFEEIVQKMQLI
jgi:hypothetical protein